MEKPLKYCLYARKSTEAEEKQALSIDSQTKEMNQLAEHEGLNVVEIRRESHPAKESGQRPVFEEILKDIDDGIFNTIITWAPDRLIVVLNYNKSKSFLTCFCLLVSTPVECSN